MGDSGHREVRSAASTATSDGFARRSRKEVVTAIFEFSPSARARRLTDCHWSRVRVNRHQAHLHFDQRFADPQGELAEGTVTGKRVVRAFNKPPRRIERYCVWFDSLKLLHA